MGLLIQFPVEVPLPQELGPEGGVLGHGHDLFQRVLAHLRVLHHRFQQIQVIIFLIFHTKIPLCGTSLYRKGGFYAFGLFAADLVAAGGLSRLQALLTQLIQRVPVFAPHLAGAGAADGLGKGHPAHQAHRSV